ncbi:SPOR domain-containing protein [Sphingomonas sp. IC-56]|uniref:SPOR domain-containing protein n=1 Tax=Sphingomonas sp. IC-56 TaxID=2898529 RepID=UPI001E46E89D|nr:SPOR domain-containing protein [Sphingomonas sp. IC-56]MCD2325265.1 SPOR domain-containing protein [Sphingomonas sp. IC-56]
MKLLPMLVAAAGLLVAAPVLAQDDAVKAGVDAYERGDYRTAVDRWRGAATAGNADAQFNLGQAYKLGRGVPVDLAMAEQWYGRAARQGHEQAEANYGLALFENGRRSEALSWLERAVARGDARAQYVLGIMLFNGDGATKDWVRAYALTVRASQAGLDAASKALAQMDKYVPLDDRQKGQALARRMEQDYSRGPRPLPPVQVAETEAPVRTPPPRASSPRPAPVTAKPEAERPAPARPAATRPAPARDGGWRVQVGAFGDPGNARRLWSQVSGRFAGRQPYYVKAGSLTKLLVGPYGSRAEAAAACGRVSPCVPVAR